MTAPAHIPTVPVPDSGAILMVYDGATSSVVPLTQPSLTLGRAEGNTIRLTQPFVSNRHARIEADGDAHRIIDLKSTNGILYNGERIEQHRLYDGDVLRIGDPATGTLVTLTYMNPRAPAPDRSQAAERYPLDPAQTRIAIGRSGCDIVLSNPQVSRMHAQLERQPDGRHLLRDAGSSNGTFVNGARVVQHTLASGDIIQIGPFRLVYTGASLERYDQRGAMRIDARNLTFEVRRDGQTRQILRDISLSIAPREFVALVGGSGAGKSTLLKALCGYARATGGDVRVNGDDFYRSFDAYRATLGYVPQDDAIHRALAVGRALSYIARLRLPPDTREAEINQRIERVLSDMEISEHRQKPVRVLSGGQRKRVSIGSELLADPGLFFLDEPASGLDPGLEKKLMYSLRGLADSGRTVVLVTHATENIAQCDLVTFLSQGRLVYFGPPAEALDFFGVTSGNFADIYLKLEGRVDPQAAPLSERLQEVYAAWRAANPQASEQPGLPELWEEAYRRSPQYQRYVVARLQQAPAPTAEGAAQSTRRPARVSPWRQFRILTRRYLDLIWQDRRNLLLLLLQAPLIALLLLLVTPADALTGATAANVIPRYEAKKALFMLMTACIWFGVNNAVMEVAKERSIFRRERLVNLGIGAYLASKAAVLGLLALIQSLVLLLIFAARVNLGLAGQLLLPVPAELFLTLLLTTLASTALGLAISAAATTPDRATSTVPLVIIPQLLFAGLLFSLENLLTRLLSWFTISRWSMDALGTSVKLNELCHLPNLAAEQPGCLGAPPADVSLPGGFTYTAEHLLRNWAILALFIVAGCGLAAWQLLRQRDTV